jgi:hypothetical protein
LVGSQFNLRFLLLLSSNQINNSLELDFQQPGSDIEMHLHNMPKERLPKVPSALKELSLQFNLFAFQSLINIFF